MIDADAAARPHRCAAEARRPTSGRARDFGFHFVDHVAREAKAVAGIDALTANSYTVRSTINPALQRATEAALQEGLARYEIERRRPGRSSEGRAKAQSCRAAVAPPSRRRRPAKTRARARSRRSGTKRAGARAHAGSSRSGSMRWKRALPLYDVHWPAAIVVGRNGDGVQRRPDRRPHPAALGSWAARSARRSSSTTWCSCRLSEGKGKNGARRTARAAAGARAALVLENKTGRILAMAGGFSYPLSQLNRTTQSQRQPGSALKPLTYLAALQQGCSPTRWCATRRSRCRRSAEQPAARAKRITGRRRTTTAARGGVITLRRALENSQESRDRQSARRRHRQQSRAQPRPHLRARAWRRRSTANACAIIRSCSARSRCG